MSEPTPFSAEGGCACRAVRYRLTAAPLVVHGCHCRWCQRETGSALAINAMVERTAIEVLAGEPEEVLTPSESGKGQRIHRCPACKVALWSHYPNAGPAIAFVRTGTLDEPDRFRPDAHIFITAKQPWLTLPEGVPAFPEYYDAREIWPPETIERFNKARSASD